MEASIPAEWVLQRKKLLIELRQPKIILLVYKEAYKDQVITQIHRKYVIWNAFCTKNKSLVKDLNQIKLT